MINRRHFIGGAGSLSAAALLGGASVPGLTAGEEYKALVVVYLNGGNDGNNVIVPTDGAYSDYQTSRANLALSRNSLASLSGTAAGHTFGLHASLTPLAALYNSGRLAFISNVGPLIEPATGRQVLDNAVRLPPFLMSHNDQTAMVQGWNVTEDISGWAGRGLETLPSSLRHPLAAVTMDTNRTLVLGRQTPITFMPPGGTRWWGTADLAFPETPSAQALSRMARWQSGNAYEGEYARTLGTALFDSTQLTQAFMAAKAPAADFGNDWLGTNMRALASVLPFFKSQGLKRQVFLTHWGGFDTHANQRGGDMNSQDSQFVTLGRVLDAFDATNRANGLDMNVTTLVMTEFGRTLRPGSGGGSEHAWGNHWWLMGGPVAGGTVHGTFPSLVLGGPDDGDPGKNGRHVPSTSSDQVGASLMQWLGMESVHTLNVFPNLANFKQKTLPLIRV